MRILHVLDHSLPVHSGYTFRTRAILKAQERLGWTVAGISGPRQPDAPAAPMLALVDGLRFYRAPAVSPAPSPIGEWREITGFARHIESVARDFRPDILHAHSPVLNAVAARMAARRLGLPLLYEIRAFWEDAAVGNGTGREGSLRYRLTRWLETREVRRADAVAVICEGLRGDLIARGIAPDKIMVSPNGVDLDLFGEPAPRDDALAAALGLESADEVVGYIGSFYDYEGLDHLIDAMPHLVARRPRARLLLVGGGPVADALRARAAASSAAHAIRFVGRVPHDEVERYYSLTDILCYPRKRMRVTELVTPLKPLEAMAQGRLVAASDVGGHRELIRDGDTGTLFPADDPAGMAAALAGLLADRSGWDARRTRARAFVDAERNWSSNVSGYRPVYQRLVDRNRTDGKWSRISPVNA
ncbi:TIGR04063 family PEP-CTERM/XrtA system glycosyltransferase [Sphingomonas sp. FW199]|uniref:TIGR04063 family PEP-CTERM/XrtA system glycosyltransferase n=1 Tax=Sphingomonas sp. FW199 TaxID=3400217 RepID=UPI003CEBED1B